MKERVLILLISLIVIIAVGILFQYGEKIIHGDAVEGYSTVYFNSSNCSVTPDSENTDALRFTIRNLNQEERVYRIIFLINNEEIRVSEQNIGSQERKSISPSKTVTRELQNFELDDSFEYTAVVEWNGLRQMISKQITVRDE
ncbi:MAG: hypothetical protein U9M90_02830 [Patescibacteria group bacterium]|nr:hypothetical protein [Patescibacteria group bacterium]